MSEKKTFTDKLHSKKQVKPESYVPEDSGDRRLREMGIDPDGDPIDIMTQVWEKYDEIIARHKAQEDK